MAKRTVYPESFKRYVRALTRLSLDAIHHGEYCLNLRWSELPHPSDDPDTSTPATIRANATYLYLTVTVYPEMLAFWKQKDYFAIADALLHEVSHLLLEPVCDLFVWDVCASQKRHVNDVIERQTQRIANALMKQMGEKWYLAPTATTKNSAKRKTKTR